MPEIVLRNLIQTGERTYEAKPDADLDAAIKEATAIAVVTDFQVWLTYRGITHIICFNSKVKDTRKYFKDDLTGRRR
jgi:hypothetical protein